MAIVYNGTWLILSGGSSSNRLKGDKGDTGEQGIQGLKGSFAESFEIVSKNLSSWAYSLNYTNGTLTSIVYTLGLNTITKTLNYTNGTLTSIVLSGNTPGGINLTKTLSYTADLLTNITYS